MEQFKYSAKNEAPIYESIIDNKGKKIVNRILLGTYVTILSIEGEWAKVITAGTPSPGGWMHKNSLTNKMGLKIFFLDVGQGDGVLLEIGKYKILIDAGPSSGMYNYLTKWQYQYILKSNRNIHIDFLIVSHFDMDHYKGFIEILKNKGFTFGTIGHPGILKYSAKNNPFNTVLGDVVSRGDEKIMVHVFDDLLRTNNTFPFNLYVSAFLRELNKANTEGRVQTTRRYGVGDIILNEILDGQEFKMEVLAPFTEKVGSQEGFLFWKDGGKTINGHSLVIKATYGNRSFLLGGDLNTFSQNYLMKKYSGSNPFEVDVAKSCHHGSSDFSEKFMALVNPFATVISSGDNESHSHPRADAVGCAGKYSKSIRPLVYSTELARSTNLKKNEILFGMINLRCNGKDIFMSQMKEAKKNSDVWDSYEVK